MSKNTSVIEINGNRYDAITGQLIGAVKKMASQVNPAGRVIDGFIKKPSANRASKPDPKVAAKRRVVQNAAHQPQKAQTLMRNAVTRYAQAFTSNNTSQPKARSTSPKPGQVLRAKIVPKNAKVNRFNKPLFATRTTAREDAVTGRVIRPAKLSTTRSASLVAATAQPLPSLVASLSPRRLEYLLDEALTRADYHKDLLRRQLAGNSPWGRIKLMSKWLTVGVSSLVIVLLAGFFAWQNIPQVSMRVAASEAHVSAAVPSYTPLGYSFTAPVSRNGQAVTIKFTSTDNTAQNFSISQQTSNWDSATLAANIGSKNTQVQTSQINGTTVYIYGASDNARWVNHGVLHTLDNHASLSSDQILKIAGSTQ